MHIQLENPREAALVQFFSKLLGENVSVAQEEIEEQGRAVSTFLSRQGQPDTIDLRYKKWFFIEELVRELFRKAENGLQEDNISTSHHSKLQSNWLQSQPEKVVEEEIIQIGARFDWNTQKAIPSLLMCEEDAKYLGPFEKEKIAYCDLMLCDADAILEKMEFIRDIYLARRNFDSAVSGLSVLIEDIGAFVKKEKVAYPDAILSFNKAVSPDRWRDLIEPVKTGDAELDDQESDISAFDDLIDRFEGNIPQRDKDSREMIIPPDAYVFL